MTKFLQQFGPCCCHLSTAPPQAMRPTGSTTVLKRRQDAVPWRWTWHLEMAASESGKGNEKLLLILLFREQKTCRHRSLVQGITKCSWKIRCWLFTPVTGGAFFQHSLELAGAAGWLKWTRWEDFSDTEITWEQGPSIYVLIMLTYVECLIQKFIDFNKACKPWWKNVLSTKMCLSLSWTMTVHLPPNYLQHSGFL